MARENPKPTVYVALYGSVWKLTPRQWLKALRLGASGQDFNWTQVGTALDRMPRTLYREEDRSDRFGTFQPHVQVFHPLDWRAEDYQYELDRALAKPNPPKKATARKVSAEEKKLLRQIEQQRALVAALGKMAEARKGRAGRKGKGKISAAVKQEAVERYAAGESLASIASDLGISTTTVSQVAVDAGMRRQQKITPSRKRKVVDLYRAGYSGYEAAEATGLPVPTVYKILSQAGVTRPGEHGPITRSMALDAIREGSSAMEVATLAGVSPATVAIWAEKAGLTVSKAWTGPTGVGKDKGDLMLALREQGFSYAEIGKRVGANASTVRDHLASLLRLPARAGGIKARRNPRKKPRGDDYEAPLYHVTYSGRLAGIAGAGLIPGAAESIGGQTYAGHRKGAIFLTEPDGLSFWHEKAEEWAHHRSDDLLEDGLIPVVLRVWPDVECKHDEPGTRDAGSTAWKCLGRVEPDEIEIWSGVKWLPVDEYEDVDASAALDEDGYMVGFWDNALVPTEADMAKGLKPNPPRSPKRKRAKKQDTRTSRAVFRRLMRL